MSSHFNFHIGDEPEVSIWPKTRKRAKETPQLGTKIKNQECVYFQVVHSQKSKG